MTTSIDYGQNLYVPRQAMARFVAETDGFPEVRTGRVDSALAWDDFLEDAGAAGAELLVNVEGKSQASAVLRFEGGVVAIVTREPWGEFSIELGSVERAAAERALSAITVLLPPVVADEQAVNLSFWMLHPMGGGVRRTREVPKTPFDAVAANYPLAIRDELTSLATRSGPPAGGRMMVFHGPPGTGKTRFIQSLACAWQSWCDVHYIVDPDMLLSQALYLNEVLFHEPEDEDRWRLVVIEDGDEFIDVDAKDRVGQGVARLLNITDGLIGQGLKVMVLITTNVAAKHFLPAAIRSGRCGADIHFPGFTPDEATTWCAERGVDRNDFQKAVVLADLFGEVAALADTHAAVVE